MIQLENILNDNYTFVFYMSKEFLTELNLSPITGMIFPCFIVKLNLTFKLISSKKS